MKLSEKIVVAALGAVATYVAQRAITGFWTGLTDEEPPDPRDPEVPTVVALSWAIASGIGLGVTKLLVSRHAMRKYGAQAKPIRIEW